MTGSKLLLLTESEVEFGVYELPSRQQAGFGSLMSYLHNHSRGPAPAARAAARRDRTADGRRRA